MAIFKATANIPMTVKVNRIAAVGSDYGPQARVSGDITEATGAVHKDVLWYMPGKADAFNVLKSAGVIDAVPAALPDGKDAPQIPLTALVKEFKAIAYQPAGQKYPSLQVDRVDSAAQTPTNQGPGVDFSKHIKPATPGFKDRLEASMERDDPYAATQAPNVAQAGSQTAQRPTLQGITAELQQALIQATGEYSNPTYLAIVRFVRDSVVPELVAGELPLEPSPESFAAMVNTLFIQVSRHT